MRSPNTLDDLRTLVLRPASVAKVLRGRIDFDPFRSCLGEVRLGTPGESWPTHGGRPMLGVAQLDVTSAPNVPACLADIALLTVFVASDNEGPSVGLASEGEACLVRAYPRGADLVPVPSTYRRPEWLRTRYLTWESVNDVPAREDLAALVGIATIRRLVGDDQLEDALGSPVDGTKLGGWPSMIQGQAFVGPDFEGIDPVFCFQIDSEESVGLNFMDNGVLHFGRSDAGGSPVWVADIQSY